MPLKLGQAVIDPLSRRRGEVVRFIGETAICRDFMGGMFRLVGRGRYTVKSIEVRIIDPPSDWMPAKKVTAKRVLILGDDPVWSGAVIGLDECEKREAA